MAEVIITRREKPPPRAEELGPGPQRCRCGRLVSVLFSVWGEDPMCSECVRCRRAEARAARKEGK